MHSADKTACLTIIAFHHAGGSPAAFAHWRRRLGRGIRLITVSLPGRQDLEAYKSIDFRQLLCNLDEQLHEICEGPYVIYGHSMGATIGYAFAMFKSEMRQRPPTLLLVGAAAPPGADLELDAASLLETIAPTMSQDDESAVSESKRRQLASDLQVLDRARHYCTTNLRVKASFPIHVFVGSRDPLPCRPSAWRSQTAADVVVESVVGDHFLRLTPSGGHRFVPGVGLVGEDVWYGCEEEKLHPGVSA